MSHIRPAILILTAHALSAMLALGPLISAADLMGTCTRQQVQRRDACCCGTAAADRQCTKCSCGTKSPRPEPASTQLETRVKCVDAVAPGAGQCGVAVSSDQRRSSGHRTSGGATQRLATLQLQGIRLNV